MNKTMDAIANATREARTALENQTPFRWQYFGNGKYSVEMRNDLDGKNTAVVVSYRGTAVVNYAKGKVRFENRSYYTPTTKNVMNAALAGLNADLTVYQKDFSWFVNNLPYVNGHEYPVFRDDTIYKANQASHAEFCRATGNCQACAAEHQAA